MSKRILALLLALALIVGVFAACGNDGSNSSKADTPSSSKADDSSKDDASKDDASTPDENSEDETPSNVSTGPDPTDEHYDFTLYYYYDWQPLKEWGADAASKYWGDKFNVGITFSKPDADPDSKLNLMLTGGDLPDSMVLDRGRVLNAAANAGALVEIEQFMYEGCTYLEDVSEVAREMQRASDGKLYGVPNWCRGEGSLATGGNYQYIIETAAYEAAGSPKLETMDDLHDFAAKVKELVDAGTLKSYSGQSMLPYATSNTDNGFYMYAPFYRSLGTRNLVEQYFTQEDGKLEICVREPKFIEALKMANQWFNEGLFSADVFSDSKETWEEKLTNGRPALMWYDFSQDDSNNFRRITREKSGGASSYEVLGDPNSEITKDMPMFPKANSDVKVVFGDENATVGWNVNVITTHAERPQRIFDLFTYMISKEGSFEQLYGPEGGLWDGLDENGYPKLTKDYADITSAEMDASGAWLWTQPASSDWIDGIKFYVNDQQPEGKKNWVVSIQSDMCSESRENPHEGTKFITDQNTALTNLIDPQDPLGISLKAIQDELKARLPQIMMAKNEDEFNKMVSDVVSFCESNDIDEILKIWQERYDANIEMQGFDAYSPEHVKEMYGIDIG